MRRRNPAMGRKVEYFGVQPMQEFMLYADNTHPIANALAANRQELARQIATGEYDARAALRRWTAFVDHVSRQYRREIGAVWTARADNRVHAFSEKDRRRLARDLRDGFEYDVTSQGMAYLFRVSQDGWEY